MNLDLVELLRSAGYTWDEISKALMTTLWRRVKEGKLVTTKYTDISDTDLDVAVIDLQHYHPKSGQVLLQGLLQARGICVQRHRLRDSLKRVDPLQGGIHRFHKELITFLAQTHCGISTATTVSLDGDLLFTVALMVTHGLCSI